VVAALCFTVSLAHWEYIARARPRPPLSCLHTYLIGCAALKKTVAGMRDSPLHIGAVLHTETPSGVSLVHFLALKQNPFHHRILP